MKNQNKIFLILAVILACIICLCLSGAAYYFLSTRAEKLTTARQDSINATGTALAEQAVQLPTATAVVATPVPLEPTISPEQQTWLVMLYQNADDELLEFDIFFDANEAEYIGSSERVTVVSQLDRYGNAFDGDGDWSGARRYHLVADEDLNSLNSPLVADLGEVNMGDIATLVDFAVWAIETYPADRYVLILSDHGAGWHGGWSDMDSGDEGGLLMREIDAALGDITQQTGIDKFDLVAFDACLMAQLESFTQIAPHTRLAVASEETIPSIGMAYAGFLSALQQNPAMSPHDLAVQMVETYIDQDLRIIDNPSREALVLQAFSYSGTTTPEEVAYEFSYNITLTAVNLEALPYLNAALNSFAYEMTFIEQPGVARARTYAQSYYNIYGNTVPPSFIDLGNFINLLEAEYATLSLTTAANRVYAALDDVVIAERHGPDRPGSTGVSIYFPNSTLYQSEFAGYNAYIDSVDRFVEQSQWDDFLAFHYSGTAFEPDYAGPVIPAPGSPLQVPGLGDIDMGSLLSSAQTISQGESVHLETVLSGKNIGYIYFFAGKFYEETQTFLAIDADYVIAETTKEVNGVFYPLWPDGEVTVSIDWTPNLYFINDGINSEFAVLYPLHYGATREQNIYAVDGIFTYGGSGEQRYAVMSFAADGWMIDIFTFNPEGAQGPRQILPSPGDSFTLLLKAIAMPETEGAQPEFVEFQGGTLYFGERNLYWDYYPADPGQYVAGVGALDLDGNYSLDFVPIIIR